LGPGGEALVDPKPPTPGLDRWTARPPIPDVLPGEDRTFGDGLFVDLIPRTDDPVRMRDAVEGVGAVGGLLRSYPSSVLIAVHEPVHELLTARTSGAHCGASSSDDAPGRSQCGHQRPDYGSEG